MAFDKSRDSESFFCAPSADIVDSFKSILRFKLKQI